MHAIEKWSACTLLGRALESPGIPSGAYEDIMPNLDWYRWSSKHPDKSLVREPGKNRVLGQGGRGRSGGTGEGVILNDNLTKRKMS